MKDKDKGSIMLDKDLYKDNVQPLRAITGGKDIDGPWILNREEGDMIVCKDISREGMLDFNLGVFTIVHMTDKSVRLVNPQLRIDTRVDPVRFCNRYGFVEVLWKVDLNTFLEKEDTDGEIS